MQRQRRVVNGVSGGLGATAVARSLPGGKASAAEWRQRQQYDDGVAASAAA